MKRLTSLAILILIPHVLAGQPRTAWERLYRGPWTGSGNWNCGYQILTDDSGNVYVGGYSPGASGNFEMTAIKYTPKGDEAWVRRWTSSTASGNAYLYDMAMDQERNAYLAGCTKGYDAAHNKVDQLTVVAFSAKGETLWTSKPFKESSCAWGVEVDPFGNIIVVGDIGSPTDVITIRYDRMGDTLWTRRFDFQTAIGVPKPQNDEPTDLAVDAVGSAFITGYTDTDTSWNMNKDILLLGYSVEGERILYQAIGNVALRDDWGDAIKIDKSGQLAWAGTSKTANRNYDFVISSKGWFRFFNGEGNSEDWAYDVAIDNDGNVITVGRTMNKEGNFDFGVVKYSPLGDSLWAEVYDGPGRDDDRAFKVAIDDQNNIYVTGMSYGGLTEADWATLKYSPSGELMWEARREGLYEDWPQAIAVRGKNLYVTGRSGPYGENDWLTIRYVPDVFRPRRDGWDFANTAENMWPQSWWSQFDYTKPPYPFFLRWPPINATSADFPDWPLFVDVFGIEQCYKKAGEGSYYFVPSALLRWRSMVGSMKSRDSHGNITSHWTGSCAGFALSSLLYYNDLLSLKWTLGNYNCVNSVPINDESRYLINKYFITNVSHFEGGDLPTGPEGFSALKTMLLENYTNDQYVSMQDRVTGAAHAVVACSLAAIGSGWWELPIYDPNYPSVYMHLNYSEITEEWSVEELSWNDVLLWLTPIVRNSQTPILPAAATSGATPGASSDSSVSVFNSPYADIRIRNSAGETIGFAGGALIDSMPGARVRFDFSETGHPPGGYFLPPGDYTASIGSSLDSTTYFTMFLDSTAFSFHREGAGSSDNEVLRFSTAGGHLSVTNPDSGSKPFFLQSIEKALGEETVCRVHVRAMPGGDSLGIELAGERNVALLVGGQDMTADLWLELAKDYANPLFRYGGIVLEGGATYLVAPLWDSLATIPLRIYVDRDRDGTPDDTLFLENQTTDVPQERQGLVPDRFELHQNYPNPFNSGTMVHYEVPEKCDVHLSVYDILGREVALLVNEQKSPGSYTVRFDASKLASGVYLCRLAAGQYTKTVKMALIR
jgi:hypothetical protein